MAILREGRVAGYGGWSELREFEEILNASPADDEGTSLADAGPVGPPDNPQDEIPEDEDPDEDADQPSPRPRSPRDPPSKQPDSVVVTTEPKVKDKYSQTEEIEALMEKGRLVQEENREQGCVKWKTYNYYLRSVGFCMVSLIT
jgi:hypothetical protein